jgi:hypothetical protein
MLPTALGCGYTLIGQRRDAVDVETSTSVLLSLTWSIFMPALCLRVDLAPAHPPGRDRGSICDSALTAAPEAEAAERSKEKVCWQFTPLYYPAGPGRACGRFPEPCIPSSSSDF